MPVAHELAPTEPAGEKRCASGTRMSAGLISRFGRCFLFATGKPHPSRQARLRGRRPLLCSAARLAVRNAQPKNRASQKQRSDFLAAPVHMAPPGRQKSECAFCLFGGVFLRSVCRAVCRGGRLCAACRCCGGLCDRCPGVCSLPQPWRPCVRLAAIVPAFCGVVFRPTRRLPLLRPACASCRLPLLCLACAAPWPACRLSAVRRERRIFAAFSREAHGKLFPFLQVFRCFVPGLRASLSAAFVAAFVSSVCLPSVRLCVRVFRLSFVFSCLTFSSQTSFHLSLRPRRASTFFRKESRQRFARGAAPSNPIPAPCGQSFSFPRCWPA